MLPGNEEVPSRSLVTSLSARSSVARIVVRALLPFRRARFLSFPEVQAQEGGDRQRPNEDVVIPLRRQTEHEQGKTKSGTEQVLHPYSVSA